jgi:hypothetical protein
MLSNFVFEDTHKMNARDMHIQAARHEPILRDE